MTPPSQQGQDGSLNEISSATASKLERISLSSPPENVASPPMTKPRKSSRPTYDAFLAGEAKELQLPDDEDRESSDLALRGWNNSRSRLNEKSLAHHNSSRLVPDIEKRPDSSRARLGLRASMLVRTEAAPWEAHTDPSTPPPLSPISTSTRTSTGPLTPRTFVSKSWVGSLRSTNS